MQRHIAQLCESTHSVVHHEPDGVSDRIALAFTRTMRFCADTFFAKRYGHRAIVLETVAAVPGMVGATQLPDTATLRDVVPIVRADEAHHRDVNHSFADQLGGCDNPDRAVAPCPPHVEGTRRAA